VRAEAVGFAGAVAILTLAAGCASLRPGGDGGWDAARRRAALEGAARAIDSPLADPARIRPVGEGAPEPIDLATALERARRENRRLAAARAGLDASGSDVTRALGRFLPATTASGRYARHTDPRTNRITEFATETPGASPPSVTIRDDEEGTVNGRIELPIDWSGELRASLAAAQASWRSEAARVAAIEIEEQAGVVAAYFGFLEARALHVVAGERIRLLDEQLENARRRFDAGRLTKNELLVVEVALADAHHERYRTELAVRNRRSELNRRIGAPIAAATEPIDVEAMPDLPDRAAVADAASKRNPVLRGVLEEIQAQEARARALRRARLPRLAVGGEVDATTADVYRPRESATGYVGFRWDLGTDLEREAEIARADRLETAARRRLEQELLAIEEAIRIAFAGLDERRRAAEVARAAVGQSEENLRIRREQFAAGRATSEDVLDAEALLSAQRAAHASARYQAHVRRAELFRLIGLAPDEELAAGEGAP
jgi:outer membrane protein